MDDPFVNKTSVDVSVPNPPVTRIAKTTDIREGLKKIIEYSMNGLPLPPQEKKNKKTFCFFGFLTDLEKKKI